MARIYNSSFSSNPSQSLLFPGLTTSEIEKWHIESGLPKFSQPEIHFYKITDSSTGEMVGFVRWGFPFTPASPPEKKAEEGSGVVGEAKVEVNEGEKEKVRIVPASFWPEGTNLDFADEKFGALVEWRKKYVKWEETYGEWSFLSSLVPA
jgi:hypothetical protein